MAVRVYPVVGGWEAMTIKLRLWAMMSNPPSYSAAMRHREMLRAQVVKLMTRGVVVPHWLWTALFRVALEVERLKGGASE